MESTGKNPPEALSPDGYQPKNVGLAGELAEDLTKAIETVMTHESTTVAEAKPTLTIALGLWLLWALLPLPMVWFGLYQFKAFWLAIVLYGGVVCTLPLIFLKVRKVSRPKPWLAFTYSRSLLLRVVILIALTWLVMEGGWLWFKMSLLDWKLFPKLSSDIGIKMDALFWVLVGYFVILNPIVEECFWRGIIYERLKIGFPKINAMLISAALFGGWHWIIIHYFFNPGWQIAITLMVCLGGIVFAWLYDETDSLLPGIIVHGVGADLMIMLILWDALHTVI